MKNKDKIIILKAKIIKLKEQLKAARLELADRDNGIVINSVGNTIGHKHPNDGGVMLMSNPIESTQELFEGKGYVYYNLSNNHKCYAVGITDKDQEYLWDDRIEQRKLFNSFDEFKKEYEGMLPEYINPIFEPIEKQIPTYKIVIDENDGVKDINFTDNPQHPFVTFTDTPLTPPTKENIDYDFGG